jgi:hypothetical protein
VKFALLLNHRRVLPLAVGFAAFGAIFAQELWVRLVCVGFALVGLVAGVLQVRARPAVIVDERGYAVEEHGREKLRVAWSEVLRVRADPGEHALYVDVGDPARNLLVPPRRGYGFHFERADELYARVVAAVGDKVEIVARLDTKS